MAARTAAYSLAVFFPCTSALPRSAVISVTRILMSVVFPAPSAPRSPKRDPSRTSNDTSSSAMTRSNFLQRPFAVTAVIRLSPDLDRQPALELAVFIGDQCPDAEHQ